MSGYEALNALPAIGVCWHGTPRKHVFKYREEFFSYFVITLIAGVMESDQYLVRQPARITRRASLAHPQPGFSL